jgi:hypothetical protein
MDLFYQEEAIILIRLLLAHILGDFVLQSDAWITKKKQKGFKSSAFYMHLLVIGGLTYFAIGQFNVTGACVAFVVTVTHGIIDLWKISNDKDTSIAYFIADQVLHILVLVACWLFLLDNDQRLYTVFDTVWNSFPILLVALGYLFCISPSSFIVKFATKQMISQDKSLNVKRGGRIIGIFERLIIFTFVLYNQYEAIGFLITGKSILRFADGQKKETEYVLVGTMISYTLAVLAGAMVNLFRPVIS